MSKSERDSNIIQLFSSSFTQLPQERRKISPWSKLLFHKINICHLNIFLILVIFFNFIYIRHFTLKILHQHLHRLLPVSHPLIVRMSRDANDTRATKLRKVDILELFWDCPRNQITSSSLSTSLVLLHRDFTDSTFKTHLQRFSDDDVTLSLMTSSQYLKDAEDFWKLRLLRWLRRNKTKYMMSRSIREHLKIIGSILW